MPDVEVEFRAPYPAFLEDRTPERDIEGALSSGKTTACLFDEWRHLVDCPGIVSYIGRYSDGDLSSKLAPAFEAICQKFGTHLTWHAEEKYYELENGSRCYAYGLKSPDRLSRYCVAPDTLILTADLRWIPAASVRPGEVLVGVDEEPLRRRLGGHRRIIKTMALGSRTFSDERYLVTTTRGTIVVNLDHPFLRTSRSRPGHQKTHAIWTPLRHLAVGDRIKFLAHPWTDRSDSWLAGLIDGEGHVSGRRSFIGISQNPGAVFEHAWNLLMLDGFEAQRKYAHKDSRCVTIGLSRFTDQLRVFGSYRPLRFRAAAEASLDGHRSLSMKDGQADIVSIQALGRGDVVGIETTSKTLITNGFISHNSKLRGMGVHRLYVDQAEELPPDFPSELRARVRLQGWPHQLTFSPNPVGVNHWLAKEFPEEGGIEGRVLYQVSLYDNAHNLPLETVQGLERAYPPGHAKHRTMVLGRRGLNVIGDPIYGGLFERHRHVRTLFYDPFRPLVEAFDFGQAHPCWIAGQFQPHGGLHLLAGIQGQDLFLEEFLPIIEQSRSQWFPQIAERLTCCDPAGSHQSSQGIRQNAVALLRQHHYSPRWEDDSNAPDVRVGMIERLGAYMLQRTASGERFGIEADPSRWLRASRQKVVPWPFLADGCEAGAVWDVHMVSVGSKQFKRMLHDGEYDHGQVCLTYLERNFGAGRASTEEQKREAKKRAGTTWQPVNPHWAG